MDWFLYGAVYVLGYATCKTFYFLNASRSSINMLKGAQLTCLLMLARSMEHFSYSRALRLHHMKTVESSDHNIQAFNYRFEDELITYKKESIKKIIDAHPGVFQQFVEFDSWRSGMRYLEENRDLLEMIQLRSMND